MPGVRRDHDAPDVHLLERRREQHRPGRAVGDQREVARVGAVADRDVRDLLGDVGDGDAVGVGDAVLDAEAASRATRTPAAPRSASRRISPPAKSSGSRIPISRQASVIVGRVPPRP